jgi:hypothetical protein
MGGLSLIRILKTPTSKGHLQIRIRPLLYIPAASSAICISNIPNIQMFTF